jgi:hypothetical protein
MRINGKEIFEKGGLMFNLSRMASLEYQDKYLVHATDEDCENPKEMVYFLCDSCANALLEEFEFCFLPYERDALRELRSLILKNFKDDRSLYVDDYEYLVYHDKSWIEVRELALKTIHIFGYDLDDFNYDFD